MDLLQLKYFQDSAVSENFSHTAQKYMVPPSCISHTIKRLEQELNVKLFDRSANKLKLNNNGKMLLSAVDTVFSELDSVKARLRNLSEEQTGEICILLLTNRKIITSFIAKFRKDFPLVSFRIEHTNSINYKNYDIIISDRAINNNIFEEKLFVREEIKLAVSESNPISKQKSIDISALKEERFISMPQGSSLRYYTDTLCNNAGFIPNIAIESDDPYYIREYLKLGLGVAFVPEFSWKGLFPNNISLVTLNTNNVYRETKVFTKKNAAEIVRQFSATLKI